MEEGDISWAVRTGWTLAGHCEIDALIYESDGNKIDLWRLL
jgi:hypothetical protein